MGINVRVKLEAFREVDVWLVCVEVERLVERLDSDEVNVRLVLVEVEWLFEKLVGVLYTNEDDVEVIFELVILEAAVVVDEVVVVDVEVVEVVLDLVEVLEVVGDVLDKATSVYTFTLLTLQYLSFLSVTSPKQ
jgi:hypothetical protein